jgi:hypothetical protein
MGARQQITEDEDFSSDLAPSARDTADRLLLVQQCPWPKGIGVTSQV